MSASRYYRTLDLDTMSKLTQSKIRQMYGVRTFKELIPIARDQGAALSGSPTKQIQQSLLWLGHVMNLAVEDYNRGVDEAAANVFAKAKAQRKAISDAAKQAVKEQKQAAKEQKQAQLARIAERNRKMDIAEAARRKRAEARGPTPIYDTEYQQDPAVIFRFLNELRVDENKPPLAALHEFERVFNVRSLNAVIEIGQKLMKVQRFYGMDEDVFKEILLDHQGMSITVAAHCTRLQVTQVRGVRVAKYVVYVKTMTYHVPIFGHVSAGVYPTMVESAAWDWKDSSRWIVVQDKKAYISRAEPITARQITQSYLKAVVGHCVFDEVEFQLKLRIKDEKTSKHNAAAANKLDKLKKRYKDGVPDDKLQSVADALELQMTIKDPFGKILKVVKCEHPKIYIEFWNGRRDHLEASRGDKVEMIETQEEINQIKKDKEEAGEMVLYKELKTGPFKLMTPSGTYMLKNSYQDAFRDHEQQMIGCRLDASLPVSKFIEAGCRQTASIRFGNSYTGYIDQRKSYTQFKICDYYEGFLGKVTDFRKSSKIQGIGYYLVGKLDFKYATPKLKEIQTKFKWFSSNSVMFSPILKMLRQNNVKFEIIAGCWGSKIEFEFGPDMMVKDVDADGETKVARYSRWVGCASRMSEEETLSLMCCKDFAAHVSEDLVSTWDAGVATFRVPKKCQHLAHVAGAVYAYQQLNLLQQIMKMDVKKLVEVRVDGIKFMDHEFELRPTFRHIPKEEWMIETRDGFDVETKVSSYSRLVDCASHTSEEEDEEEEEKPKNDVTILEEVHGDKMKFLGYKFELLPTLPNTQKEECMLETRDGFDVETITMKCKPLCEPAMFFIAGARKWSGPIPDAGKRNHDMIELWTGAGGSGKTHVNLTDTGLVGLLYVAPSHKLERAKAAEYGVHCEVMANILGTCIAGKVNEHKIALYRRAYNVMILDEASMISVEVKNRLCEIYPDTKLIFCGDIGFQLPPIQGTEMRRNQFENEYKMEGNRRCKCPKLAAWLKSLRDAIAGSLPPEGVDLPPAVEISGYDYKNDMILAATHETKNRYENMDGKKYRVIKNSDVHSNGDIIFEDIGPKKCVLQHAFTTHSVQGETVTGKLFIHQECLGELRMLYTAISRAQYASQIVIIKNSHIPLPPAVFPPPTAPTVTKVFTTYKSLKNAI